MSRGRAGLRTGPLLLAALLCAPLVAAADAPPRRAPESWIHDGAELLTPAEEQVLADYLDLALGKSGVRLAVVTLAEAHAGTPKSIAVRTLNDWRAGQQSALLLISVDPRELYLQPGTQLAGALDEPSSSAICADVIAPKLRAGQALSAIIAGLDAARARIEATRPVYVPPPLPDPAEVAAARPRLGPLSVLAVLGALAGIAAMWRRSQGGVWWRRRCPDCGAGMVFERIVDVAPTRAATGSGRRVFTCEECHLEEETAFVLPKRTRWRVGRSGRERSESLFGSSGSSSSGGGRSSDGSGGGGSKW